MGCPANVEKLLQDLLLYLKKIVIGDLERLQTCLGQITKLV